VIRFLESAGDFSLRRKSRVAVEPTHTYVRSAPANPSVGKADGA